MEEAPPIPIKNIEELIIQEGFLGYCLFLLSSSPDNAEKLDIQVSSSMTLEYVLKSINFFLDEIISKYPEAKEEIQKIIESNAMPENPYTKFVSF